MSAPPPSKPDRRVSRIRLSSQWVLCREGGRLFASVPKNVGQTFGAAESQLRRADSAAGKPLRALASVALSVVLSVILPLSCVPSLHGRYPLPSYYGRRSDSRQPDARTVVRRTPALAGLPDYRREYFRPFRLQPSACCPGTARLPAGLATPRQASAVGLQPSSPTMPTESSSRRRPTRVVCVTRLVVLIVPLLPTTAATQLRFDTARFFTAQKRTSTASYSCLLRRTGGAGAPPKVPRGSRLLANGPERLETPGALCVWDTRPVP